MIRLLTLILLSVAGPLLADERAAQMARGKALYEGPGGCYACHQLDGNGLPQVIPPLAGSDWIKDSPERRIHVARFGLEGPIKVNERVYNGLMPPQTQFEPAQIADILTYVGSSWGNEAGVVSAAQVAAVKYLGSMDAEVLMKKYPFPKNLRGRNGVASESALDAPIDPSAVTVVRTLMPGASPAAIAVALPGPQYYCWDAGECRLRYAWTKGGFISNSKAHWSSNGKPVPIVDARPYYRSHNSLIELSEIGVRNEQNQGNPVYDTSEADDFPFSFAGLDRQKPRYKGYALIEGHPEFIYQYGDQTIREKITTRADKKGIDRHFTLEGPPRAVTFQLAEAPGAEVTCTEGTVGADAITIPADRGRAFVISIREIELVP
jgi:mono/diheme cytochrome c family protein